MVNIRQCFEPHIQHRQRLHFCLACRLFACSFVFDFTTCGIRQTIVQWTKQRQRLTRTITRTEARDRASADGTLTMKRTTGFLLLILCCLLCAHLLKHAREAVTHLAYTFEEEMKECYERNAIAV